MVNDDTSQRQVNTASAALEQRALSTKRSETNVGSQHKGVASRSRWAGGGALEALGLRSQLHIVSDMDRYPESIQLSSTSQIRGQAIGPSHIGLRIVQSKFGHQSY